MDATVEPHAYRPPGLRSTFAAPPRFHRQDGCDRGAPRVPAPRAEVDVCRAASRRPPLKMVARRQGLEDLLRRDVDENHELNLRLRRGSVLRAQRIPSVLADRLQVPEADAVGVEDCPARSFGLRDAGMDEGESRRLPLLLDRPLGGGVPAEQGPAERDALPDLAAGEDALVRVALRWHNTIVAAEVERASRLGRHLREAAPPSREVVRQQEILEHAVPRRADADAQADVVGHGAVRTRARA